MKPRPPDTHPPLTAENAWDWRTQALLMQEQRDEAIAERDRARATAVALEQELAHLLDVLSPPF